MLRVCRSPKLTLDHVTVIVAATRDLTLALIDATSLRAPAVTARLRLIYNRDLDSIANLWAPANAPARELLCAVAQDLEAVLREPKFYDWDPGVLATVRQTSAHYYTVLKAVALQVGQRSFWAVAGWALAGGIVVGFGVSRWRKQQRELGAIPSRLWWRRQVKMPWAPTLPKEERERRVLVKRARREEVREKAREKAKERREAAACAAEVRVDRDGAVTCLSQNQLDVIFEGKTPERLGCGSHACVYTDPRWKDAVIKITDDHRDVQGLIRMRYHPRVVTFDTGWRLRGKSTGFYAIRVDRMVPLSDERLGEWASRFPIRKMLEGPRHWKGPRKKYHISPSVLEDAIDHVCASANGKCEEFVVDVFDVHEQLFQRGVRWYDLHEENVMEDPKTGAWRIIDLGHGWASQKVPLPALKGAPERPRLRQGGPAPMGAARRVARKAHSFYARRGVNPTADASASA